MSSVLPICDKSFEEFLLILVRLRVVVCFRMGGDGDNDFDLMIDEDGGDIVDTFLGVDTDDVLVLSGDVGSCADDE